MNSGHHGGHGYHYGSHNHAGNGKSQHGSARSGSRSMSSSSSASSSSASSSSSVSGSFAFGSYGLSSVAGDEDVSTGFTVGSVATTYYLTKGQKFEFGYYYKGPDHHHWSAEFFSEEYGCTLYHDAGLDCDYYWCSPDQCFYPVSYCPYQKYRW